MKFYRTAKKQLRKLPAQDALRIVYSLLEYSKKPQGYVKWLEGRPGYRIKIGDYRVIFEFEDNEMAILTLQQSKTFPLGFGESQ